MRRKSFFICCSALVLVAALGWSADNPYEGKTACVFPLVDLSPVRGESDRQKALSDAMSLEFQTAGLTIIAREKWEESAKKLAVTPNDLLEAPAALSLATASGADIAVSGFFSLEDERILVSVSCYDTKNQDLAGGFMRLWRFNLGFYNSLHSAISGMLSSISFSEEPSSLPSTARIPIPQITFTSTQDGMEVVLAGEKSAGRIENGKLVFPEAGMLTGTPLLIEKRKEGYHTARLTVPARGEIALTPLAKKTTFAIEADWTTGQLIGAGAALRYYPIPDSLFVSLSLYPYVQLPSVSGTNTVLHLDSDLQLGLYLFFSADSPFRLGVSTGFGGILTTILGAQAPFYTDLYLNVVNLWFEWNLSGISFFLRSEMKYTLGIGTNLLDMDIVRIGPFPPLSIGTLIKL
jgi:hypothetical protein